jgi:hypothetical protein
MPNGIRTIRAITPPGEVLHSIIVSKEYKVSFGSSESTESPI